MPQPQQHTSLLSLPLEVLQAIASNLGIKEATRLARVCCGLYAYRDELLRSCNPLRTASAGTLHDDAADTHFLDLSYTKPYVRGLHVFKKRRPRVHDALLVKKAFEAHGEPAINILRWMVLAGLSDMVREMVVDGSVSAADMRAAQLRPLTDACSRGATEIVRILVEELGLEPADLRAVGQAPLIGACDYGSLDIARYLVERLDLTRDDVLGLHGHRALMNACERSLPLTRFLFEHFELNAAVISSLGLPDAIQDLLGVSASAFSKPRGPGIDIFKYLLDDLKLVEPYECLFITMVAGHASCLHYLCEHRGITLSDVRSEPMILRELCSTGGFTIGSLRYLHEYVGITIDDFRADNNVAIRLACSSADVDTVAFLVEEVGLTIEDIRSNDNAAIINACTNSYAIDIGDYLEFNVLRYLMEDVGLGAEDALARDGEGFIMASRAGRSDVIEYLVGDALVLDSMEPESAKALVRRAHDAANTQPFGNCPREWRTATMSYLNSVLRSLDERGM